MIAFVAPPYRSLPGVVSSEALAQHLVLYRGYVDRAMLPDASSRDVAGALLHRLYFSQLTDRPDGGPRGQSEEALIKRWGSVDAWWSEMRAAAEWAHGWAITAIRGNDLRVLRLDAHDDGAVIGYEPLVVVDVCEHAWWMDNGTRKMEHVDGLLRFFDWAEIERRFQLRACGEREAT